ncbi:MICAL-like protein 1 isoform X2 [Denticeps clupeoides]|uniref:MICAL-like protein 1 n=1 Tax=Denticeps clupeoides TaxID=299321 RepID=A0AAY4D607_9TELE|nr:MICAL-like protein 1 isoform X2 [Denticeps clupeoides]
MSDLASVKTLQDWCRKTCKSYSGVEINNMTTSFRDGLAFCAIIHKHRPDLIDFSSLSKENVFENNHLAFEIAETQLGIPALLDPKDMVFTEVPDRLSVITYLSQYYTFFNRLSDASFCNLKTPKVTLHMQNDLKQAKNNGRSLSSSCAVCQKHVHLVQRLLVDGKLYHRSCFRCCHCKSTLLPGSYRVGDESASLLCAHFCAPTKNCFPNSCKHSEPKGTLHNIVNKKSSSLLNGPPDELNALLIVYRGKEDKSSECRTDREVQDDNYKLLPPAGEGNRVFEGKETTGMEGSCNDATTAKRDQSPYASSTNYVGVTANPVSTPHHLLNCTVPPQPSPRSQVSATKNSSLARGDSTLPHILPGDDSSNSRRMAYNGTQKSKDHPWMDILHPGPWAKLPPVSQPSHPPRSRSVPFLNDMWYRWKAHKSSSNPFDEDYGEEGMWQACSKGDEGQTQLSTVPRQTWCRISETSEDGATSGSENVDQKGFVEAQSSFVGYPCSVAAIACGDTDFAGYPNTANFVLPVYSSSVSDLAEMGCLARKPNLAKPFSVPEVSGSDEKVGVAKRGSLSCASDLALATEAILEGNIYEGRNLTKSISEQPLSTAAYQNCNVSSQKLGQSSPQVPYLSKQTTKENPFNRKAAPAESTKPRPFQDSWSTRAPAPGHGFPLIKRKVQTDQFISEEDVQAERVELEKCLERLDLKGVELERNLRSCHNDEEGDNLVDWFTLIHEKHILLRRDAELVYVAKQQKLEERQSDVEFELRCLLNKPEKEWNKDDKDREKQLMEELVIVIEQRNHIITNMDLDRQREKDEDMLLSTLIRRSDFNKSSDYNERKLRFKPEKILKMFSHKTEILKGKNKKKS